MVLFMKVNIRMVKNMEKEDFNGLMVLLMKGNLTATIYMDKEPILGKMEDNIMENG